MFILRPYKISMSSPRAFDGSVAENYDAFLGPVLFEPFAIDLASRVNVQDCQMVLEIAAGTGRRALMVFMTRQ
jgi:hypothetical protein